MAYLPPRVKDETGKRYGKLRVIEFEGIRKSKRDRRMSRAMWRCKCDCDRTVVVSGSKLRNGHTKSCGCTRRIKFGIIGRGYTNMKFGGRSTKPSLTYVEALERLKRL